ncbi:MAG TPA: hypothetical protein VN578_08630 [Candidatus Binatia bacterium]|jgi:plastocyanin|nr:hypothetical protein [Candidatus Binatia bacterium]
MKLCTPTRRLVSVAGTILSLFSLGFLYSARAATTNVSIGDNFFSPTNVTINLNDSVQWTWTGFNGHSSTSLATPALWDTGLHSHGFTFTLQFTNAGSFPYHCTIHNQMGTVIVAGPIQLSSPKWTAPSSFQFSYAATPGLSYIVQRSGGLPNFVPLSTNVATSSPVIFVDTSASGTLNFYSVKLQPNP